MWVLVFKLYFAKVKLGSAATELSLQIDTGSDLTWVTCKPCDNCPKSTVLGIELNSYDPKSSTTASLVPCSSQTCASLSQSGSSSCSVQGGHCSYHLQYEDESRTLGYYVYDRFAFNTIFQNSLTGSSSAQILCGCSTHQDGQLTLNDAAVDGILAFGPQALSIISQLSSQGIAPKAFSHCFRGDGMSGGTLVLGQILEPSIIYTPLDPSQSHYTLNMQSIAVNGQSLPIDPAVLSTSTGQGTIVDTGTTLVYLVPEAYQPFLNAITAAVTGLATPLQSLDNFCYHVLVIASINVIFPHVSLKFSGGASLNLRPVDYLIRYDKTDGATWCMGFQKAQDRFTILGDIVLKDRIFVYDLDKQRIGWADYDCSSAVNVSLNFTNPKPAANNSMAMEGSKMAFILLVFIHFLFCCSSVLAVGESISNMIRFLHYERPCEQ